MKKTPIPLIRIFLYLTALILFGIVVYQWWFAYYHKGIVIIHFNWFNEMLFEFFFIHLVFIMIVIFVIISIKKERVSI